MSVDPQVSDSSNSVKISLKSSMSDPGNIRLSKADREILKRIAEGWRPLRSQIPHGSRLERRGLLRLDWGPENTPDAERMVWYLTDRAYSLVAVSHDLA